MESSKKILLTTIAIAILVVLISGVTFAFFNYTRTGTANTIKVGRISFVTNQTDTISLNNIFPIDPTETGIMDDETKVGTLEITIEGDTDYSDGIEYLVSSVDSSVYTSSGQLVPISLDVTVDGLGTVNPNYFTARDNTNTSIYKQLVGETLVGDQMLLVGYIAPNSTPGIASGIDGSITIKAYLDENKILISDTYDGTESDNMGTPNSLAQGKTVLTTSEWNSLQSSGLSFKVKVEANEGIWVNGSLEEIMRKSAVMDNISSTYVSASTGINFGAISSDTNGKGVYMRAGTENDIYPIMYYRGEITDNNVIFNNKCWKAVRTTETGGVKLIYNGETGAVYEETSLTESQYTIPSGATNNFTFNSTDNTWEITITDNAAKEISFTVPAGDGYKLVQTGTSGSATGGAWYFYKDGTTVRANGSGGGSLMNDIYSFGTLTASNVIKWKYVGSSSAESPITFKLQMLRQSDLISENGFDNEGPASQIIVNGNNRFQFNLNNNSPAYNGYMYGTVYTYSTSGWTSGARFGSSFTWDGTNYTLVDDSLTSPNATHHYSCNITTASGTCQELRYVYYVSGSAKYYITLTGGDGVEEALVKMHTNTNDSNAKAQIDTWYASNMNTITNKLEDTIWCNDRSIGDNNNNGWIANGGDLSTELNYGADERSNLACTNKNDAFTVNNANGNRVFTYPVGLLTANEIVLAGCPAYNSSTFYLNNLSESYWSLSPSNFHDLNNTSNRAYEFIVGSNGLYDSYVSNAYGLRPAISIKPGQLITKGTGTVTDPYVIE